MTALSPSPRDIIATFLARWFAPTQRQLDALLVKLNVPVAALMYDNDGDGYPMGMLRVDRSDRTFEFSADHDARPVCGFLAWDLWNEAQDIVAWSPRDGWVGSWLGKAALLNEFELQTPRGSDPLPVHIDMLSWLRSGRDGCVVLDKRRARLALEGVKLAAASVEDGLALRRLLSAPEPKIVVPARAIDRVAA